MIQLVARALVSVVLVSAIGCTRSVTEEDIRLVIPFNNSSSSLAVGDKLHFASINIQGPGRIPIARQFDFDNNPVPWGSTVQLEVPNVPSGNNVMIQFMGVYETSIGASYLITYGDVTTNIASGSSTTVNIVASAAGTATKEGRVSGRYFWNDAREGPTGPLSVFYNPPNGNPRMLIEKSQIVAGYFNIFVLDNIPLTYSLVESTSPEYVVFSNLTIGSPAISGGSVFRASLPTTFKNEERDGVVAIRQRPASEEYIGFIGAASVSPGVYGSGIVYYAGSSYVEGLAGLYGAITTGGKLISPIRYADGGGVPDVRPSANGTGVTYGSLMTHSSCPPGTLNCFNFYHHRLSQGDHDASGINPPFALMDPFTRYGGYLSQTYAAGPNELTLNWKYLPGAAPTDTGSGYDGVEILYKYFSGGGSDGGGDHDKTCADYKLQGYIPHGTVTSASEQYVFQGAALNSSNHYNFQFMVCPYKSDPITGSRRYIGKFIRSSCSGGCGDLEHFGWASTSGNVTMTGPADFALGIHHSRVTGIDASTSQFYTSVAVNSGTHMFGSGDTGKEVMFVVQGKRNATDCGQAFGNNIEVGMRAFSRLLAANSSELKIPKGTFMDGLDSIHLASSMSAANSCYVQAVLVPHFQDLFIQSSISISGFSSVSTAGGGVLPFRVSGVLSISGGVTISADGAGYLGGGSATIDGGGYKNASGFMTYVSGNNGGGALTYGGGGAGPRANGGMGIGASSAITDGTRGESLYGMGGGGDLVLAMGGGGGGNGGNGGGIIFMSAREIIFGSGAVVTASGGNHADASGGGGGGGTIVVMANRASGNGILRLEGGDSVNSLNNGGAGGGGSYYNLICNRTGLTLPPLLNSGTGPVTANIGTLSPHGAQHGYGDDANLWSWGNPTCRN